MRSLPRFKRITEKNELKYFSSLYGNCSGLPIPENYLYNSNNRILGIYYKKQLIGGFILGNGPDFRTIELFAKAAKHENIYQQLEDKALYTEICCFWIDSEFRSKTSLNFFVWLTMTYCLKRYGRKYFLFGTCSRSLARLYGQTKKSIQIHRDFINGKATFVFWAKRRTCITGMLEIIVSKFKRKQSLQRKVRQPITV